MDYAFAHQGRPQGMGKWVVAALAVLLAVFGCWLYIWMQKDVEISLEGNITKVKTFKSTVGEVLQEAGIEVYPKDLVTPGLNQTLAQEQRIEIIRAFEIAVEADGKQLKVESVPATVQSILALANITLGEKDIVEPELTAVVHKGTVIKVSRITEELVSQKEKISFRTELREDKTLERGIRRVIKNGADGLKEETVKIVYKDGKKIGQETVSSRVLKEPVNKIVAMGVLQFASRGGNRFEFDRALEVNASAYTHTGNRTCTGTVPKVGTVAVDPQVIPLKSRLYVEGYGFGVAEDTGSAIKGNAIDVFLETEAEARRWGRRTVKVYLLK